MELKNEVTPKVSKNDWISKLKPNKKNLMVMDKIKNLQEVQDLSTNQVHVSTINTRFHTEELRKFDKKEMSLPEEYFDIESRMRDEGDRSDLELLDQSNVLNNTLHNQSALSDCHFEELGNLIEEKFMYEASENQFLNKTYHSIIPFLLMSSKEVHRMAISDFEIHQIYKIYMEKKEESKLDGYDFYRIGIVNFYKGDYIKSYSNFKTANLIREKDLNIAKWLAFNGLILIFCPRKIDFSHILDYKADDSVEDKGSFSFFSCCGKRSTYKPKKISSFCFGEGMGENLLVEPEVIANEILALLERVIVNGHNAAEGYWLLTIISFYCKNVTDQTLFESKTLKLSDPMRLVKKIREYDMYLSYIVYCHLNYNENGNYNIEKVLFDLIVKYSKRIEAYLMLWQLLVRGKLLNFNKALKISEFMLKKNSNIHLDNDIYYIYMNITYAKTAFLQGNTQFAISIFQKEYINNFFLPSYYYLFGKCASKSNSFSYKNIGLSSLKEIKRLLHPDLQKSSDYWIGNIYYNTGDYINCFQYWSQFISSDEYSYDYSPTKIRKINLFRDKYESLCNSLKKFQWNISYLRYDKSKFTKEKEDNFFSDNESLKVYKPNIQEDHGIIYDLFKAQILFYGKKDIQEALTILVRIILKNKYFMNANYLLWDIFKFTQDYALLLRISYFIVKLTHSDNKVITSTDWIRAYKLYSKALFLNNMKDDAITVLINLLDLYVNIPNEETKFINKLTKKNNLSLTNEFLDSGKNFFSKRKVYNNNSSIFKKPVPKLSKKLKNTDVIYTHENIKAFYSGYDDIKQSEIVKVKDEVPLEDCDTGYETMNCNELKFETDCSPNEEQKVENEESRNRALSSMSNSKGDGSDNTSNNLMNINQKSEDESLSSVITEDTTEFQTINTREKLIDFINKAIMNLSIPKENHTIVTLITDHTIMYEIGKLCSKSKIKLELGQICLDDFILITRLQAYYKNLDSKDRKKIIKAQFWKSIIHIHLKEYSSSKQIFDFINNYLDESDKKTSIIKKFNKFYEKLIYETSQTFDITEKELENL